MAKIRIKKPNIKNIEIVDLFRAFGFFVLTYVICNLVFSMCEYMYNAFFGDGNIFYALVINFVFCIALTFMSFLGYGLFEASKFKNIKSFFENLTAAFFIGGYHFLYSIPLYVSLRFVYNVFANDLGFVSGLFVFAFSGILFLATITTYVKTFESLAKTVDKAKI